MASNVLTTCFAPSMVSSNNRALSNPLPVGLGPRSSLSRTPSLVAPSSRPSGLVVRAQQGGSPRRTEPVSAEQFYKKVALLETSPYGKYSTPSTALLSYIVRTPWNTTEDDHEIRMWFDMPGIGAENIQVDVIDDLLVIKGDGGVDAFGNQIFSPYDSRVQIPHNSWKEEITALFKNGVLYITVPKLLKQDHKIIHIPVRSI